MKTYQFYILSCFLIFPFALLGQASTNVPTSAGSFGAWTDPALNHNRLLMQQSGEGVYRMVGAFKVIGNPYLFGESHKGDMFTPDTKAYNITLSYNTYNQELEFLSTSNPDKPLVKEPGTVDSFFFQQDVKNGMTGPMKFIYGPVLGSKDKSYFLELFNGSHFSVYKKYKSDLDYVSTNYVQSELRQFNLQVEYYYKDAQGKGLKKVKANEVAVIKEFKNVKDVSKVISNNDFTLNPDAAFKKVFAYLNY